MDKAARIAQALANSKPKEVVYGKATQQWELDVKIIADCLQEWGPDFNRGLFYSDCGYEPDPIGKLLKK